MIELNREEAGPAPVVALVPDLFFAGKVRATAKAAGVAVRTVSRAGEVERAVSEGGVSLILVDLEARGQDVAGLIERLKAEPATAGIPVVAFCAHVNEGAIRAARTAGADRVVARSAFVRELPALLLEAKRAGSGGAGPAG